MIKPIGTLRFLYNALPKKYPAALNKRAFCGVHSVHLPSHEYSGAEEYALFIWKSLMPG